MCRFVVIITSMGDVNKWDTVKWDIFTGVNFHDHLHYLSRDSENLHLVKISRFTLALALLLIYFINSLAYTCMYYFSVLKEYTIINSAGNKC